MDVTQIPFNRFLEIVCSEQRGPILRLRFREQMTNHLGTMHASAQYALAEACSGLALQHLFPDLAGEVVPVVRGAEISYKKPAQADIQAEAAIDPAEAARFTEQYSRKGRGVIVVPVVVKDTRGAVTMTGGFEWFVQKVK